jgi:hypothetical protein
LLGSEAALLSGSLLVSVLNTPLTLSLKWKFAIHFFYVYHIAVHSLLITTIVGVGLLSAVGGDLRSAPPSNGGTFVLAGLFLGVYGLSLWGLALWYRESIQCQREAK